MITGVIGAGAMGSGIAQIAAQNGSKTYLYDNNLESLTKAKSNLTAIFAKLLDKGKINQEQAKAALDNIVFSENLEDCKTCDIVIEAIVENLEIKKKVFSQIESIVSEDCILSTNTSSLSIASISSALKNPERFLGIHFFNPAPIMPLVEIVPSFITSELVVNSARNLIDSWGKVTALAKDTPGFIVNRIARPFYGEAMRIYEEGIADIPTIDWALKSFGGFRMGPFELTDFIGHDVNYTVTETVWKEFYYDARFKPSLCQKRLVEAGFYGKKSGRGFYDYRENAVNKPPKEDNNIGKQIFERILAMLINEAVDSLRLKLASKKDIELAMTKGVNYPKGLLQWCDDFGAKNALNVMDNLYDFYREERYRASPLLREIAKSEQKIME